MQKIIVERPKGYMRPVKRLATYCDNCGQRIIWCVPHPKGQFCDTCLTAIRKAEKQIEINKKEGI